MTAYLFTWNEKYWSHQNVLELISMLKTTGTAKEPWRCAAYRKIRAGDRAYVLRQGVSRRGVFACATVSGNAFENSEAREGQRRWLAPLSFHIIVDPKAKYLISQEELIEFGLPEKHLTTRQSGIELAADVADAIDRKLSL